MCQLLGCWAVGSGQWAVGSSQSASPPVRRLSLVSRCHQALCTVCTGLFAVRQPLRRIRRLPGTPGTVAVQAKLLATSPLAACHGRSLDPRLGRIDSLLARTRSSSRSAVTAAHRLVPVEYRGPSARGCPPRNLAASQAACLTSETERGIPAIGRGLLLSSLSYSLHCRACDPSRRCPPPDSCHSSSSSSRLALASPLSRPSYAMPTQPPTGTREKGGNFRN
jgi:hypothetical protein